MKRSEKAILFLSLLSKWKSACQSMPTHHRNKSSGFGLAWHLPTHQTVMNTTVTLNSPFPLPALCYVTFFCCCFLIYRKIPTNLYKSSPCVSPLRYLWQPLSTHLSVFPLSASHPKRPGQTIGDGGRKTPCLHTSVS